MNKIKDLDQVRKDIENLGAYTRLEFDYPVFKIKIFYHDTCIIEVSETFLILNNGGFQTRTTQERINQVLRYFDFEDARVYTEKKIMIADFGDVILPFKDGKKIKMPLVKGRIPGFFTGVLNANIPEWIHEEFYNAIDLMYEEFKKETPRKYWESYESMESDYLLGDWVKYRGLFQSSKLGEYSAIYRSDSNVIQVIKSQWYKKDVRFCSPCYPNQADLETGYGDLYAFDLPFDLYGGVEHASINQSTSFYIDQN